MMESWESTLRRKSIRRHWTRPSVERPRLHLTTMYQSVGIVLSLQLQPSHLLDSLCHLITPPFLYLRSSILLDHSCFLYTKRHCCGKDFSSLAMLRWSLPAISVIEDAIHAVSTWHKADRLQSTMYRYSPAYRPLLSTSYLLSHSRLDCHLSSLSAFTIWMSSHPPQDHPLRMGG